MKPKTLLSIILLILSIACITFSVSNAQQNSTLSITPSIIHVSSAQIGATIDVNLTISNIHDLYGWSLNLTWNPNVLNLTDIKEGPFLSNVGPTLYTWNPSISMENRSQGFIHSVADVLMDAKSVDGSGVLATIKFQVLNIGTSSISIDGSRLATPTTINSSQYLTATITNGIVTVDSKSDSLTLSPTPQGPIPTPTIPEFSTLIITISGLTSVTVLLLLKRRTVF